MNFAVLLVRDFALQALLRADPKLAGKPVAVVTGDGRKARIAEVSEQAVNVERGLAVTLALARCPSLSILAREPDAETEASRLILATAFTLSPRVEATADGCCTVDLTGADPEHVEARLGACVAELMQCGLRAQAGAGASPLLAFYAAQRASPTLVVRHAKDFLTPLPLEVAKPTRIQSEVLRGWGIGTLGQLTALPKAEIGRRLGTDAVGLWERAAGETTRLLKLVEPAKSFSADWDYEPPVESMEPLLFRLRRHAECLALELRGAGVVAEEFLLVLRLEDESEYRRTFRLPEPGANVDGWMRVLFGHLETVRTAARVTGVRLVATPARPLERQDGLFETGLRDPVAFFENLARVGAIIGDDRVGTPVMVDTWRPDTIALEKPTETVPAPENDPVHPMRGLTLRRFRPAWPARVTLRENRLVAFDAPNVHEDIRCALGPFRADGGWWRPADTWAVEVWRVEVASGATYQLAHRREGWCVEGVLD